ncbi:YfbU family protein [Acinetobacter baumannii]|uniref:YfbU family protein n=1 Tax=Acinetobacter calcoaceticus/baumannii complex TaxID=909768 RepID=UPI00124ECBA8|nr:YfbU family protein [Acinetobacter seifertii]MDX7931357.1 YfbU family protein [Acinetobacter baumannii]
MSYTKSERLILINQYKILASLESDNAKYYNELIQILENGYQIFYSSIDQWLESEMTIEDSRFVLEILDLYRSLEDLKRRTQDQNLLDHPYSIFKGFDGNNESEYISFTRFLIDVQGKFQEQKKYLFENDHLNSHMPMVSKYKKMLEKSKSFPDIWSMTVDNALEVLDA